MRRAAVALRAVAALAAVAAVAAVAAGCGASTSHPAAPGPVLAPLLGADRLPGLHAVTRRLATPGVVLTTPVPGLRPRLAAWGFRSAAVREFAGRSARLTHVVSMGVDFAAAGGAAAYGRLLLSHTDAYLGPGAKITRMSTRAGEGWLISAQSCGCHPGPPTVIAVIRRRAQLSWLSVTGTGATTRRARHLAATLIPPSQRL